MNKTSDFLKTLHIAVAAKLPDEVLARAKESLLDYIGAAYAGTRSLLSMQKSFADSADDGDWLCVGHGRTALADAVFFNGLAAHALDFDDGVNAGIVHIGSPVLSLLLPLAQKNRVSSNDLLQAMVTGYETAWSLAISLQPAHKLRGFHATGTCGMLGATIAGTYLLNFTEDERFRAFSTALCSATGTLKVLEDESELKPYNVAKASLLALESLRMTKAGFAVPADAMSGDRGFLSLAVGRDDVDIEPPLKDGKYAIMRTYTKPYAACRYCHPAIEAAIDLGVKLGHDAGKVQLIKVSTYDLAVRGHDHADVRGPSSAKMSIPFGVATGFLVGKAGLTEYSDSAVSSTEILGLTRKVEVVADENMSAVFPDITRATVSVQLADGTVVSRTVDHPLGEPENPLGWNGVCEKFREMASYAGVGQAWADEVICCVSDIDSKLTDLFKLLERPVL